MKQLKTKLLTAFALAATLILTSCANSTEIALANGTVNESDSLLLQPNIADFTDEHEFISAENIKISYNGDCTYKDSKLAFSLTVDNHSGREQLVGIQEVLINSEYTYKLDNTYISLSTSENGVLEVVVDVTDNTEFLNIATCEFNVIAEPAVNLARNLTFTESNLDKLQNDYPNMKFNEIAAKYPKFDIFDYQGFSNNTLDQTNIANIIIGDIL